MLKSKLFLSVLSVLMVLVIAFALSIKLAPVLNAAEVTVTPQAGGTYHIINQNSGKALDVKDQSKANYADVQQWSNWGGACHTWTLQDVGNGYYTFVNQNSGQVLDVDRALTNDGANVQQAPYYGNNCDKWRLQDAGNGYYFIVNCNSGKVLDVYGLATNDGGDVVQWSLNYGANQKWKFVQGTGTASNQSTDSGDRYFPAGTSKSDLMNGASRIGRSEMKALIRKQVDEHWDVLTSVCGFRDKNDAYGFFFGFSSKEAVLTGNLETGSGSAHSYGTLQTSETAYANANPSYSNETNVPEMYLYEYNDSNYYDIGISIHMGIRHFIHFAKLAKERYNGSDILKYGLMGYNTGNINGGDSNSITRYAEEIASLSGWYIYNNHLYDDQYTWDYDERVDRSNPWSWYWY